MSFGGLLADVWQILCTPDWIANTGIPLVSAVAGIAAAATFLRHQLRNDRILRDADQRRQAATNLGEILIDCSSRLGSPASAHYWQATEWPDNQDLQFALIKALPLIPRSFLTKTNDLLDVINESWNLCSLCHRAFRQKVDHATSDPVHSAAMETLLHPHKMRLGSAGRILLKWDGLGTLDEFVFEYGEKPKVVTKEAYRKQVLSSSEYRKALEPLLQGTRGERNDETT